MARLRVVGRSDACRRRARWWELGLGRLLDRLGQSSDARRLSPCDASLRELEGRIPLCLGAMLSRLRVFNAAPANDCVPVSRDHPDRAGAFPQGSSARSLAFAAPFSDVGQYAWLLDFWIGRCFRNARWRNLGNSHWRGGGAPVDFA